MSWRLAGFVDLAFDHCVGHASDATFSLMFSGAYSDLSSDAAVCSYWSPYV